MVPSGLPNASCVTAPPDWRRPTFLPNALQSVRLLASGKTYKQVARALDQRRDQAAARQPLEVPAVPIYIQEKIHPQAIIEDLRAELVAFARRYNETWLVARHGYKTPARVREEQTMSRLAIDPTPVAALALAA